MWITAFFRKICLNELSDYKKNNKVEYQKRDQQVKIGSEKLSPHREDWQANAEPMEAK